MVFALTVSCRFPHQELAAANYIPAGTADNKTGE